jgi:hypothetical protein
MVSTKLRVFILASAVFVADTARALPQISFDASFTFRAAPNPLSTLPAGDFVEIGAGISAGSTPDPISSVQLEATQGTLTVPLSYSAETAPLDFAPAYFANIPFAGAPLGSWSITATDSTGTSAPVFTPALANPQLLPFITDITVSDSSTTPTVTWTTPDLAGFDVDETSIRLIDAYSQVHLYDFGLGPPTAAMSFKVPDGLLTPGGSYIYMVILTDREADSLENWSSSFSPVTRVPEPTSLTLMLATLASIGGARFFTRAGRSPASHAERARVAVTKAIRDRAREDRRPPPRARRPSLGPDPSRCTSSITCPKPAPPPTGRPDPTRRFVSIPVNPS